jgi:hypothetical protein
MCVLTKELKGERMRRLVCEPLESETFKDSVVFATDRQLESAIGKVYVNDLRRRYLFATALKHRKEGYPVR